MKKILIALMLVSSVSALADSSTGCGLGSLIWKENSILSALFRSTTNHSFSSQLFGITSGTSGCSKHSIVKRDMAPVYYAEANVQELKIDMARGEGEYLTTFAEALGCPDNLKGQFNAEAQKNFSTIFPNSKTTPLEMLNSVKTVINKNNSLQGQCTYAVL